MTAIYADLVTIDVHPLEAARILLSGEARAFLESLGQSMPQDGAREVWSQATLFGVDWGVEGPRPPRGEPGVSLEFASLAGRGFWTETRLPYQVDERDRAVLADPEAPSLRQAAARDRVALAEAGARVRGPRVEAIRALVELEQPHARYPLRAMIDVHATWQFDFVEGFRRRLAYALAFEASIRAGSRQPYLEFLDALIAAPSATLARALPDATDLGAFSIGLNLLQVLRAARTTETLSGHPDPRLPGSLIDAAAKEDLLAAYLRQAADHLRTTLTSDGQIALRALQIELDQLRTNTWHYEPQPPLWGRLAPSSAYRDS